MSKEIEELKTLAGVDEPAWYDVKLPEPPDNRSEKQKRFDKVCDAVLLPTLPIWLPVYLIGVKVGIFREPK